MTMELKGLYLFRSHGRPGYRTMVEFDGEHEVKLQLPQEISDRIVELCLDEILQAIRSVSDVAREQILRRTAAKEIEHQETEV